MKEYYFSVNEFLFQFHACNHGLVHCKVATQRRRVVLRGGATCDFARPPLAKVSLYSWYKEYQSVYKLVLAKVDDALKLGR